MTYLISFSFHLLFIEAECQFCGREKKKTQRWLALLSFPCVPTSSMILNEESQRICSKAQEQISCKKDWSEGSSISSILEWQLHHGPWLVIIKKIQLKELKVFYCKAVCNKKNHLVLTYLWFRRNVLSKHLFWPLDWWPQWQSGSITQWDIVLSLFGSYIISKHLIDLCLNHK